MTETWYVMEDGSAGDPREITAGDDGKLVHADGRKVAYAAHGPRSRGVDPDAERASKEPPGGKAGGGLKAEEKALKPDEPRRGYKTRESKAD